MLVDDSGKPLERSLSKEEVVEKLKSVRPKNAEQEVLLAKKIGEMLEFQRQNKMRSGLAGGFDEVFKDNADRRLNDDNWSKERHYRHIASIPKEMVYVAERIWGPDVLTDREKFREAFVKDETGRYCLSVDPKSI